MPKKKFEVVLTASELERLKAITHKGSKHSARTIMHANILLNTNDGDLTRKKDNRTIADFFDISPTTVNQVRKTFAAEGLDAALGRKTRMTPPILSKITGDFEAQVIATALSPAPEGRAKWTLRLLAEHCMERQYIVSISHSAIGDMLNTNQVKPHLSRYSNLTFCSPSASRSAAAPRGLRRSRGTNKNQIAILVRPKRA